MYVKQYPVNLNSVSTGTALVAHDQELTAVYAEHQSIATDFAGTTAPQLPVTNCRWLDTSTTPPMLKRYNGSAWVTDYVAGLHFWGAAKEIALGDIVFKANNSSVYAKCTAAGTTGPAEPVWPAVGSTITDGTVTWEMHEITVPYFASQSEAEAGTDNTTIMTPKTTKQAIDFADIGVVFGDTYLHTGCVKANGATVNRSEYPRLVALANTYSLWTADTANNLGLFGNGDGSTTMVLPNWIDKMAQFATTGGGTVSAGLPNIIGEFSAAGATAWQWPHGAFYTSGVNAQMPAVGGGASQVTMNFSANNSNSIYGSSATVQPPAIKVIPQMRY